MKTLIFIKEKFLFVFLLLVILGISLFLQIYFPWKNVFQDPIRYAADDGVYHMRLVENMLLGNHFPKRIFFDPFTYFPYGTYIHWGPFYEYLLAVIIWLISLGKPTLDLINKIAPFYPPALGTLTVLVIYFIGKTLWGRWSGLMAALLAAISSSLLFRSLLGATDYHQAEALYSSLAMLFLILAVSHPRSQKFLFWTILSGASLALYFLVFKGALIFALIIFIILLLYYILEYLAKRQPTWALQSGIIIFTITLVAISLFFGHPDIFHARLYDFRFPVFLLSGIATFLLVGLLGDFFQKLNLKRIYLPLFLLIIGAVSLIVVKYAFPVLYTGTIEALKSINTASLPYARIRDLVAEMAPLTIGGAFETFSCLFYLSFLVWFYLIWRFIKKREAQDLVLIVWFLVAVIITGSIFPAIGLRRYSYYLAVVVSLFCGFLVVKGLKFGFKGLVIWQQQRKEKHSIFLLLGSLLVIFNLFYFVFYPFPLNLIEKFPNNLPKIIINAIGTAQTGAIAMEEDWYETLKWLKDNTPDPGLDYYGLYEEPPFDPASGRIRRYNYPETAYGILASWDVGHMITYYSHRLPIANPFQLGIGTKNEPGEASFFIETDKEKAYQMLDQLKVKYVISDFQGSFAYASFLTKPQWIINNLGDYYLQQGGGLMATEKYDESMASRLHLLDGRELIVKNNGTEINLPALDRFRLVYESKTSSAFLPPNFLNEENPQEIKMVKVFEYVKGATIKGKALNGQRVEISTKVKTNQNREFLFKESLVASNNEFKFIVPYAGLYKIKIGNTERELTISEEEILEGGEIELFI